jgi:tetratricopeptide (TPR) repeat protein
MANKKKTSEPQKKLTVLRETERRFRIVPELLAAPGAINFRVIGDSYYVVTPQGTEPRSSELRRGYIQYLVDPLVIRFGREISAKKIEIKQVLDAERARTGRDITPDVFLAVARSIVAAADARMSETARTRALQLETSDRLKRATDDAARAAIVKESKERQAFIEDASVAQLADDYEGGAVLSFYFAGQLRGLEQSGFDLANFIPDMIASIAPLNEINRPKDYAAVVARHGEARARAQQARADEAGGSIEAGVRDELRAALIEKLSKVDEMLRVNDYTGAESRLVALRDEYRNEPRVYFGLGQAARLSAQDAIDEDVQAERLTRALEHYQQAVLLASPETDGALISRAHVARGRILAFLDRKREAVEEFDKTIKIGDVRDGAYKEAVAEKNKLASQP